MCCWHKKSCSHKWAVTWDFQQCGMCDQQRLSPACAYAQTDQSLCLSLNYYMSVKLLIELNLVFLSLTGGCTGSSESTLVKMTHCWESHVTVQIFLNTGPRRQSVTCWLQMRVWLQILVSRVWSQPGLILSWRLIMKWFLRSYSSLQLNHSNEVVISY